MPTVLYVNPNSYNINILGPCGEEYPLIPFMMFSNRSKRRDLRRRQCFVAFRGPEELFEEQTRSGKIVKLTSEENIEDANIVEFDAARYDLAKTREEKVQLIRDAEQFDPERAARNLGVLNAKIDAGIATPETLSDDDVDFDDDADMIEEVRTKKAKKKGKKATKKAKGKGKGKKKKKAVADIEAAEDTEEASVTSSVEDAPDERPAVRRKRRRK